MPKASPLQPSFSGGEYSPRLYGRVDAERYKQGLATCLNYLPTTQGPLLRRPATKYVGNDAKDPSKPPAFLEFKFSASQNYVLEMGEQYIRFYTNNAQQVTSSTCFKVFGNFGTANIAFGSTHFYANRTTYIGSPGEVVLTSSVVTAGSVLEIGSPYAYNDLQKLKISQKDDSLFIVHSSYPEMRLTRLGSQYWELKRVRNIDGPYLPFNSYRSPGDSSTVSLLMGAPLVIYQDGTRAYSATTGPRRVVSSCFSAGASGFIRVASVAHGFLTGDRVVIKGVTGSVEANNGTSTIASMFWPVIKVDADSFDLVGSFYGFSYTGSGYIYPALFEPYKTADQFADLNRVIGLIRTDGGRAWGQIYNVTEMHSALIHVEAAESPAVTGSGALVSVSYWQMGVWNRANGYPGCVTFHQDRKVLSGTPQYPQRIDMSVTSDYQNFQSSGSSLIVSDNNALSFNLNSAQLNRINWVRSDTHGLLAGSFESEWNITPSSQSAALTPTNLNAAESSNYGSDDADAVKAGEAILYVQRGQRRIRELNYFFQVDKYRSTDLAELSEHLPEPGITKLSVQKEIIPIIWALKNDGNLVSLIYNRDDTTLKVGWARHTLGGKSDSGGTTPLVKSIAVIPSPDGKFDQLWLAVQRFINGTSVVNIEYLTRPYDNSFQQEDAFQGDCGGTYNSPITITGITTAGSAVVSATAHGFTSGDFVKINSVVGLNSSVVNVLGNVVNSNLVNARVFIAASTSANAFFLQDTTSGQYIDSRSYSVYVSGGQARKLVSTISGLTWLKNETVSILADGGVHPDTVVNSAGVLALQYPAAKVQIGYRFNSDAQTLRPEAGAADGSSIGKVRRPVRIAVMINGVAELSIGTDFNRLTPLEFTQADQVPADTATPLFSGIVTEGVESEYGTEGQICLRQSSMLPGMIQALTVTMEENDV